MKTAKKVLKKLSAVRAVLRKDEREVLDAIVLGEVQAHKFGKVAKVARFRKNQTKAHKLGKVAKVSKAAGTAIQSPTLPPIEFDPNLEVYQPVQE